MNRFDAIVREISDEERAKQLAEVNRQCGAILADFVGRPYTPMIVAECEGLMRQKLDEMIKAGSYVLPVGITLDRVTFDLVTGKVQVLFKRATSGIGWT